jgi:hypothetical protein
MRRFILVVVVNFMVAVLGPLWRSFGQPPGRVAPTCGQAEVPADGRESFLPWM